VATSYGPVSGNSRIRFEYSIDYPDSSNARIYVAAYLDLLNGWSSNGTWPCSWSGQWGSGSASVYRNIGTNGSSLVAGDAYYYVARSTSGDYNVSFQAQAQNYTGYPSHSITLTIPRLQTAPPAPTTPSLDQVTNSSIRAQFSSTGDGGSGVTRWDLQYAALSNFSDAVTVTSWGTSTITGLQPNTTYYFRARGVNAIGTGAWSGAASARTSDVPGSFTSTVNTGQLTSTSARLDYTQPATNGSAISAYEAEISTSSAFTSIARSQAGAGTLNTVTFPSLSRVTTYYARARVKNAYGWSPYSTTSFTTTGESPSAPSDYAATDIASTTAYFTLPTVADNGGLELTGWKYALNTTPSDTGATVVTSSEYIAPFLQGLTQGTVYYLKMLVSNSLGDSAYGPWVSFTTRLDVPTSPTALAVNAITETTAAASWAAPANLLGSTLWGYTIRFAQNKAFSKGLLEYTSDSATLSQAFTGLLPGTTYYVQVHSLSSKGPGSRSAIVSFKTLGTAPSPQALWMRVAGTWKGGTMWLRVAGTWKQVTLWQRVNGTWRKN
jgi:hypothetical protein